jgi:hypothetical protein
MEKFFKIIMLMSVLHFLVFSVYALPIFAFNEQSYDWSNSEETNEWDNTVSNNWDSSGSVTGRYNIFLKTDQFLYKLGFFIGSIIVNYLIFLLIFSLIIKQNKSPSTAFTHCFLYYLMSIYGMGFICFSEYALIQKYDDLVLYFKQLNWSILIIIFAIWSVLSIFFTYNIRGKS